MRVVPISILGHFKKLDIVQEIIIFYMELTPYKIENSDSVKQWSDAFAPLTMLAWSCQFNAQIKFTN